MNIFTYRVKEVLPDLFIILYPGGDRRHSPLIKGSEVVARECYKWEVTIVGRSKCSFRIEWELLPRVTTTTYDCAGGCVVQRRDSGV